MYPISLVIYTLNGYGALRALHQQFGGYRLPEGHGDGAIRLVVNDVTALDIALVTGIVE